MESCFAGCSECGEQKRNALSTDLWNFICWVLSSVCGQIGVGNAGLNKSISLLWASEALSTSARTFSEFPHLWNPSSWSSQWTGSSGKCPRRTKGVIQEPLVHTQTCVWRLGQHVPLARGGTERRECTSTNSRDFVHRETIARSLWAGELSALATWRQTPLCVCLTFTYLFGCTRC